MHRGNKEGHGGIKPPSLFKFGRRRAKMEGGLGMQFAGQSGSRETTVQESLATHGQV